MHMAHEGCHATMHKRKEVVHLRMGQYCMGMSVWTLAFQGLRWLG